MPVFLDIPYGYIFIYGILLLLLLQLSLLSSKLVSEIRSVSVSVSLYTLSLSLSFSIFFLCIYFGCRVSECVQTIDDARKMYSQNLLKNVKIAFKSWRMETILKPIHQNWFQENEASYRVANALTQINDIDNKRRQ